MKMFLVSVLRKYCEQFLVKAKDAKQAQEYIESGNGNSKIVAFGVPQPADTDDLFLINEVVEIDKPYYDEFLANNKESLLGKMRLHGVPETIIEQVAQILKIKI